MHSKQKGSIGEITTVKYLLESGFSVFGEFGDLSKVDLIALKADKLYRIQCKAISTRDNKINLDSRKCGPNYSFKYNPTEIDIFAVYVLDLDVLFFVSSKELCAQTTLTFRSVPLKNGHKNGVKLIKDYTLDRCLRDCTHCAPLVNTKGEDTVQTTTA